MVKLGDVYELDGYFEYIKVIKISLSLNAEIAECQAAN